MVSGRVTPPEVIAQDPSPQAKRLPRGFDPLDVWRRSNQPRIDGGEVAPGSQTVRRFRGQAVIEPFRAEGDCVVPQVEIAL